MNESQRRTTLAEIRAVALLSGWKIKNSLRTLFSDPRKLVPFLLFLTGLTISLSMVLLGLNQRPEFQPHHNPIDPSIVRSGLALAMILLGLGVVDSGLGDSLLAFMMPDVDYLFPSPVSRRIVLAYRLPALSFGVLMFSAFMLFIIAVAIRLANPTFPNPGHVSSPAWVAPVAVASSLGIYLNLAMLIAIRVNNRSTIRRAMMFGFLAFATCLGFVGWKLGVHGVESVVSSPWIRWPFLPSSLASDVVVGSYMHQPTGLPVLILVAGYLASLVPMFLDNSNWYEQSIVSTERMTAIRQAAKGGYASMMASKSASFKHKAVRPYTVAPFGQGAGAVFWAHLCAAAKKPWMNFFGPIVGGVFVGGITAAINHQHEVFEGFGFAFLIGISFYVSIGFMALARTASEGAIRRRDLLSPLPISGSQAVVANLGVPLMALFLFCIGAASVYVVSPDSSYRALVFFGLVVLLPLRMAVRMTLQYLVILGYPDFSDKIQQLFSTWVFALTASPLLVFEGIALVPAILLRSFWLGLVTLALVQIPFLFVSLFLAGKASERTISTGEPVTIFGMLRQA